MNKQQAFISSKSKIKEPERLQVPAHVKKKIGKGQKDIKDGRSLTNEQAEVEIENWLKK